MSFLNKLQKLKEIFFKTQQSSAPHGVLNWRSNVQIGERVSFGGNVFFGGSAQITIGHDTMIAVNAVLHTATHDYNNHPMWSYCIEKPIEIGNHVWIGASAIIMPGVKVGDYAVIGAGSIVTAHVPVGAIVTGSPAKILKYRDLESVKSKRFDPKDYPGKRIADTFLDDSKQCKPIINN